VLPRRRAVRGGMRTAAVSSSWPFTTRTWPRPFPARPAPNPGSWRAAV